MKLLQIFKRAPKPTPHDEIHRYAADIAQFNKRRDSAMHRMILQPSPENTARVADLDKQIDIMQEIMLRLSSKEANR